jgi:hypothetical protein
LWKEKHAHDLINDFITKQTSILIYRFPILWTTIRSNSTSCMMPKGNGMVNGCGNQNQDLFLLNGY